MIPCIRVFPFSPMEIPIQHSFMVSFFNIKLNMKNFTASNRLISQLTFVFYLFLALFSTTLDGQTLYVSQDDDQDIEFYVSDLEDQDLVFYRFSDGYYAVKIADGTNNSTALVTRTSAEPLRVSAYVAKKNGPIKFAGSENSTFTTVSGIMPTVQMGENNSIRISTSWEPFYETGAIENFTDESLGPPLHTPGNQSWFFLNLTVQNPYPGNAFTGEVQLAYENSVFSLKNALIGDSQIESSATGMFPFTDEITFPGISYIGSVNEENLRVGIDMAAGERQVHIQFLAAGVPAQGFSSKITTTLTDDKYAEIGNDNLTLTANAYPYDPNGIISYNENEKICALSNSLKPLSYRAYFQNEGQGDAITVFVKIDINPDVLDGTSVFDIKSSHGTPSFVYYENEGSIIFKFVDINLPGLQADPPPLYQDTKGWVEFTVNTQECIVGEGCFTTGGEVIFLGVDDFVQVTPFEIEAKHYLVFCNENSSCTIPPGIPYLYCSEAGPSDGDGLTETPPILPFLDNNGGFSNNESSPFAVTSFPTVFQNSFDLIIQSMQSDQSVEIMVTNLLGEQVFHQSRMVSEFYKETFSAGHWEEGMYVLSVRQGNETKTLKIIKQ